jgi:hypothetical protein
MRRKRRKRRRGRCQDWERRSVRKGWVSFIS